MSIFLFHNFSPQFNLIFVKELLNLKIYFQWNETIALSWNIVHFCLARISKNAPRAPLKSAFTTLKDLAVENLAENISWYFLPSSEQTRYLAVHLQYMQYV